MSDEFATIVIDQGVPGAAGSKILAGTGVPSSGTGGDGDEYIDTATGDIYLKANGVWGSSVGNIRGPQGVQGIQGPVGSQIYTGHGSPSSGQGVLGDMYLDVDAGNIYSRGVSGWGTPVGSIRGPQGIQGIQGLVGSQITTGSGVPSNLNGANGDFYIDNGTGNYYLKISGAWVLQGQLAANAWRSGVSSWDANTNSPSLSSGAGTEGLIYLVSVAGGTILDGIADWQIDDFSVFSQGAWRKINNSQVRNLITSGVTNLGPSQDAVYQALLLKQDLSEKGNANGYAGLDSGGKVPISQLPPSVVGDVQYEGAWNANTNSPALASGTGNQGAYYVVSVAGTTALDGISNWAVGDWAIFNGTVWQKVDNNNLVQSVNSKQGTVVLVTDDIAESGTPTNLWFTDARAKAAAVENAINVGTIDKAPSEDAVNTGIVNAVATAGNYTDSVSKWLVGGTRGGPIAVAGGVSLPINEVYREYQFIAGSGGPIDLSAVNPQIQAGIQPGQELLLQGCDNTNTVTLANGNGLELNGSYIMKNGSRLLLVWDGTLWGEVTRNDI